MGKNDLVEAYDRCGFCGERRMDYLAWTDDTHVKCGNCGTVYTPESAEG